MKKQNERFTSKARGRKKTDYYGGIDGVFYNFVHDSVYVLQWRGDYLYEILGNKKVAKLYDLRSEEGLFEDMAMIAVEKTSIRLGDWP